MSLWQTRSPEERSLLNASFLAVLLWRAARGHKGEKNDGLPLPLELAFLVVPLALHREMREALPKSTTTSLAVWLEENPMVRPNVADRARALVPFTKEALLFGGLHGFLAFSGANIEGDLGVARKVERVLKETSEETQACAKKAEFVGKWFARTGNAPTVMALVGVRP